MSYIVQSLVWTRFTSAKGKRKKEGAGKEEGMEEAEVEKEERGTQGKQLSRKREHGLRRVD